MREDEFEEVASNKQLLDTVERELHDALKEIKESKPTVDFRPDGILIPMRVEFIEVLLKDLVNNCNFPVKAVKKV